MKEAQLRKWHRRIGITLSLFIILQAGSGLLISLSNLSIPHTHAQTESVALHERNGEGEALWDQTLEFIHHGGGGSGTLYRILLGVGLVAMALSGSLIFFKIRARS
ncbi:MAG: hypothetical protein PVG99_06680 [Desulfobacteraceae bacterium]|jgi:hypothetical protein